MKNFTNNFKQFTSRLSARWLIMALMMLVGTSSAWGWSYKTAAGSWNCKGNTGWSNETLYTTPTGNTTQSLSVVMLTNPGSGFNILRADNCNEWNGSDHNHCLYVGLTGTASSSSSTIVRATAYWYSNGLYSKYTVVIPEGKIYIKPTGGSAISMTKDTYTYTAELTLSDAKTFDLYANDPSATIQNQWDMPSAGKPTSVRLNYTGLTSPYKYVRVSYNLKTNRITFTEMDPPCITPDPPVVIKAVRNDRTVNESHWADFVALYVQEDGISTAGAGATKVTKYTWEYSTDGTDWVTNFTGYVLGGASATVGVTNGSEKCNNIRPTKTGKYRVKVTYDNDEVQESNIITITSDGFKLKYPEYGQNAGSDFAFEAANRTIPVFVVKTTENFPDCPASGMPSQDVEGQKAKKSVDVKIFENGNVVYDRKARMNYRGSSSLNFRKKSYAFCTGKEKTKNSNGDVDTGKENLLGLSNGAEDKDWVLYAAMPDPSMMRNRLIFDTYAQMTGKWGVDSKFVELIIDDEYMGVYVLMDKITKNANRINITAADGFILKFDKTDVTDRFEDENSEKRNTFTTEKTGKSGIGSYGATFDQRFEIEYPEMEDADSEEKWVEFVNDHVKGKIEAFEKALEAGNYTEVRKLIDYESWADWFIISEFAKNVDAYRASCYFVYDGDKIEARPLWDQELSFNNTATTVGNGKGCNSPDGLLIQNAGIYSDDFPAPFWFTGGDENITGGLLNDPCFVTMVKNRYKDHLNNALSNGQLTGKISDYETELTAAAKNRETATWRPTSGEITACTGGGTGYTNIQVSTSISTMTEWITNRPAGLTTALDALTGSSVNISIEPSFVETYPWEPFTLTVDAPEGYEYEMTFTKEGTDATSNMVVEKGGDIYTVKIKRPANTVDQVFETVPYLATATLKVADDGCGGMTTPEANANIRLNDREEDCE